MKDIVVYIHGKNGSAAEAARYRRLFADSDVLGFDYEAYAVGGERGICAVF